MSDTDIYKKREAMPVGKKPEKKQRKRRSASRRSFDEHSRKRRSKNSGIRRLLHLSRKSDNEKMIWVSMAVVFGAILAIIALWQFVISERMIRDEETESQYIQYQRRIPEAPAEGEEPVSGKEPILP